MQPLGWRPGHISLLTVLLAGLLVRCDNPPPSTPTQPSTPASQPIAASASSQAAFDRFVRVALLREATGCVVSIAEAFDVVDANRGAVLATIDHPGLLTIAFAGGAISFAEVDRSFSAEALDLRPRGGGHVGVRHSEGLCRYRGWLRLVRISPAAVSVLNVVDVEDYLLGVVPAEMPIDFESAALRAQAIASRTYAWYYKSFYGPTHDWDLLATEGSQVYRGLDVEKAVTTRAVRDTSGIVCTWASPAGERIFPAYFSSTCGGVSRAAPVRKGEPKFPVLAGDVVCDFCAASPKYRWGPVAITKKQITNRLRERYPRIAEIGPVTSVEIAARTAMGRPVKINVSGTAGRSASLNIEDFCLTVDPTGKVLNSGYFTPVTQRDSILFAEGRGYGHGWGLCQFGANALAKAGKTATDILFFYYPGCHLVRAY